MATNETELTRKNPSRAECEKTIRRILITEILENGQNKHFKKATDFVPFFESLYPASDSLTKQIQRAVKSMDMPKDENGFFIVDRTSEQYERENELKALLKKADSEIIPFDEVEPVFISATNPEKDYLAHLISEIPALNGKYETIFVTNNGVIIYTKEKDKLLSVLDRLMA